MKMMDGLRGIALLATTLFAMSAIAVDVLIENAFLPGTGGAKGALGTACTRQESVFNQHVNGDCRHSE